MSEFWLILFYVHIGAGGLTILQIIVATIAFQHKTRFTVCDKLVFPITMFHIPVQIGVFVWAHVARFSHNGKVCSGDYLDEE